MNVASLELCKELCELSGWRDELDMWFEFGTHLGEPKKWGIGRTGEFPAYDLGYLLRKLPPTLQNPNHITNKGFDSTCVLLVSVDVDEHDRWITCYDSVYGGRIMAMGTGDTPEDATCKLIIELFKRKILGMEAVA